MACWSRSTAIARYIACSAQLAALPVVSEGMLDTCADPAAVDTVLGWTQNTLKDWNTLETTDTTYPSTIGCGSINVDAFKPDSVL